MSFLPGEVIFPFSLTEKIKEINDVIRKKKKSQGKYVLLLSLHIYKCVYKNQIVIKKKKEKEGEKEKKKFMAKKKNNTTMKRRTTLKTKKLALHREEGNNNHEDVTKLADPFC